MFAPGVRRLLGVRRANHGILPRGVTPHASTPWHGGAARGYHHHQQLQQEEWEESKAVKVTVWWDFHSCRIPPGVIPGRLVPRVTDALRSAGIRGPVEITAFGDVTRVARADQHALADTGVALSHVPCGQKDDCNQLHISDVVSWIAQNPPPAHFLLISADKNFANVLHRLRMSNYNVLLSCPYDGPKVLLGAATFMWTWEPLVKGVDFKPKYLNQPPDGLSSWYGHYRGSVDDLLLKPKNPTALPRNTEEPKVPKSVVTGIKQVLHFYPEGVSVSNLRAELRRNNVFIDEGFFFGFRRFTALLGAMPDVVKFIDPLPGDTQPAVVKVFKRSVESSGQSNFDRTDSAQSIIEEKHYNVSESEELSSLDDQPSSSESPSRTEKKTQATEAQLSPLERLSRDQRTIPGLTQQAEPPSNHVEADVPLAGDVPSSHAPSIDQRNAAAVDLVEKTKRPVNHVKADKVDAAGTPSSSGAQGNISNKKGLFERISSLWNWNGRSA